MLAAQISAPGSSAVTSTAYITSGAEDPLFIWCGSSSVTPVLRADPTGGTAPFNFLWYGWNSTTSGFTDLLLTENGVETSELVNPEEGGYRVHISDGAGYDTVMTAWVYFSNPVAGISLQQALCNQVTLRGVTRTDTYYYFDINSGEPILLPNDFSLEYSSDPVSLIPNSSLHTYAFDTFALKIIPTPPLVDLWYNIAVTDDYGCVAESSFFYESFHVDASFEAEPVTGEAPLEVFFTDKSVRGNTYIWNFGDDTVSNIAGSQSYTYYHPGSYTVSLVVESDRGCTDSTTLMVSGVPTKITVEPSALDIPNVFTPDGSGENDFFYVDSKSLRYLYLQVFSKGGKRVYHFEGSGDALREWEGWDGTIGSGKAAPGIYFYIVRAYGWDDVTYDGKEYRGFFYLYR
jgi:PKD repeat protein